MAKYDITVRRFLEGQNTDATNVHNLFIKRYDGMTAEEATEWIQRWLAGSIAQYREGIIPFAISKEQDIVHEFYKIVETINDLEERHVVESTTLKVLDSYVTVQVIFPDEEANMTELMFLKGLCFVCFVTYMVLTIYAIWFYFKNMK